jgi:hypothetical protein
LDFTTPFRVTIRNTPRATMNANWHHGAINDQVQIANRLTVNLGIRWDYYNSFFPDQEIPGSRFRDFFYAGVPVQTSTGPFSLQRTPYADNDFKAPGRSGIERYPALFAPRFGVSWDVAGNGKTLLKANWGRYYQNTGNARVPSTRWRRPRPPSTGSIGTAISCSPWMSSARIALSPAWAALPRGSHLTSRTRTPTA